MLAAAAPCPACGRSACRSAAKTRSVPSRPSTLIAAAMSATTQQVAQVGDRQHEHAEHPVGAVDQRQAFLLGQHDRLDPRRAQRLAGVEQRAGGIAHRPLPHQRQRAVRERREVARAAERAVLVDDRRDPGREHRGVGGRDDRPHAGAPGGQRREPQQHQRAHDLALDLVPRARRRASGSARAAARAASRPGCAASPARRSRSRRRSAARRRRPARRSRRGCGRSRPARRPTARPARRRARRRRRPRATARPTPTMTGDLNMPASDQRASAAARNSPR